MRTWTARSDATAEQAWELISRPSRWHEWAPHVRGAWGLGSPEVRTGALGAARLFGIVPVPARIVDKRPGSAWTWRVGPVVLVHRVRPLRGGRCEVAVDLRAPGPLEAPVAAAYGPIVATMVRRLARKAEEAR